MGLMGNCMLDIKCTRLYMKFPLKTWLDCWIKCNFLGFSMTLLDQMQLLSEHVVCAFNFLWHL